MESCEGMHDCYFRVGGKCKLDDFEGSEEPMICTIRNKEYLDEQEKKRELTYVQRVQKFQQYLYKQISDMLDELDTKGYDEKYNLIIKVNEEQLEMDMNADVYEALNALLNVELQDA